MLSVARDHETTTTRAHGEAQVSRQQMNRREVPSNAHRGRRTLDGSDDIYRSQTTLDVTGRGEADLELVTMGISA